MEAYKERWRSSESRCCNKDKVIDLNIRYVEAVKSGADQSEIDAIRAEARALNKENLKIFKFVQDTLLGLMYETPVVPHESPQKNIALMEAVIAALEEGMWSRRQTNTPGQLTNISSGTRCTSALSNGDSLRYVLQ